MSWFSNRFATSLKVSEGGNEDDDDDSQGKGVKEDLSELTKTFTRQLWGVASFLAPPPSSRPVVEEADPPSFPNYCVETGQEINSILQSGSIPFSHELEDVDFQAPIDPVAHLQDEVVDLPNISRRSDISFDESASHGAPDQGLTGVGKDLAELKGSVATGFSKLLKVVREEIDRNAHAKARPDDKYDEEEEDEETDDEVVNAKEFVHGRKLPVLDSLFRPFSSGILKHDRDDMLQESGTDDDDDDDDDPFDTQGHQKSRPFGATNIERTLGESLGGVSKIVSTLFPFNVDSDDEQCAVKTNLNSKAVGVTEEVLTFVKNISMHPETWLDFPLFVEDDEDDDFDMSDAQKDHVIEVERASPRLAALRIELCPDYMSKGRFWKIYFVLLHSRLSKKDAVLLSTPQIMEARSLLLSGLQKQVSQGNTSEIDQQQDVKEKTSGSAQTFKIVSLQSAREVPAKDFVNAEIIKAQQGRLQSSGDNISDTSEEIQNKSVLVNTVKLATVSYDEEEADLDRWLHEDSSPHFSMSVSTGLANDEDVSFSDLEEDDDSLAPKGVGSFNFKGTHGWVELNKDQKEKELTLGRNDCHEKNKVASKMQDRPESSDWLTVEEDLDFA